MDRTIINFAVAAVSMFFYNIFRSILLCFVPERFKPKKNIAGKKVLITGAGSGLGRQMAIEFSKHSPCLILVDINRKSLLETEKLLDRRSTVFIYDCDVSDYKKVYAMAEDVKRDAGDVDILVNNAGTAFGKYFLDLTEENIIKTMGVNAFAHFWMCKAFLPAMMEKNQGHIVSIASIVGKIAYPRVTAYCSSKYAAVGFAEALELELVKKKLNGIKTTIVCPGAMNTPLFAGAEVKIGGIMKVEYAAKEIVNGILREKDTIYIPSYYALLPIVKEIFPRPMLNMLLETGKLLDSMDNFRGRTQTDESL